VILLHAISVYFLTIVLEETFQVQLGLLELTNAITVTLRKPYRFTGTESKAILQFLEFKVTHI